MFTVGDKVTYVGLSLWLAEGGAVSPGATGTVTAVYNDGDEYGDGEWDEGFEGCDVDFDLPDRVLNQTVEEFNLTWTPA